MQVKAGQVLIGELLEDYRAYVEVHNPKSYEGSVATLAYPMLVGW